ncbi:MAG TPA: MFS transporter, partial [Isosphaeraceae bacterium]|nr:MFS transporter [Isosphaeraceae bacterium]
MVESDSRRLAIHQGLTIGLLFVGYTGFYLCRSNLSVAGKPIQEEMQTWGLSAVDARNLFGDVVTAGTIGYAVGKFLGGTLCDFLGGKRTFLLGMLGAVLATVAFGLGRAVPLLFAAWVGNRLVQAIGWPGIIKVVSRWFSFASYGSVMGLISLSYLFGDALARRFLGWLFSEGLGWRTTFFIAAGVLSALWLLSLALLRDSPTALGLEEPEANPASVFGSHADEARPESLRALLGPLLKSPAFWLVCGLSMGMTLLRETFNTWTPTYFSEVLRVSTQEAADASAWFSFCGGVSVLVVGFLSDRIGRGGR